MSKTKQLIEDAKKVLNTERLVEAKTKLKPIYRSNKFEQWFLKNFDLYEIIDISEHGVDAGWRGITSYNETWNMYKKYEEDIWDILEQESDSMGYTIADMISMIDGKKGRIEDLKTFKNWMVWFAAETLAHQHRDEAEELQNNED